VSATPSLAEPTVSSSYPLEPPCQTRHTDSTRPRRALRVSNSCRVQFWILGWEVEGAGSWTSGAQSYDARERTGDRSFGLGQGMKAHQPRRCATWRVWYVMTTASRRMTTDETLVGMDERLSSAKMLDRVGVGAGRLSRIVRVGARGEGRGGEEEKMTATRARHAPRKNEATRAPQFKITSRRGRRCVADDVTGVCTSDPAACQSSCQPVGTHAKENRC